MIGVEDLFRVLEIDELVGPLVPGQRDQPVEIGARHGVFGGSGRHLREAIELAEGLFLHRVGHPDGVDLRAQLLGFLGLLISLAELFLDGLELLAKEVLALIFADLGLDLRLNLRAELENLELLDEDPVQAIHARPHIERREDFLLDRRADGGQARGDEIGELARIGDVGRERLQIVGEQRRQRDDLLEVALDVALQGVDLEVVFVTKLIVGDGDRGAQIRPCLDEAIELHPRETLDDQAEAAVGQLEHLVDVGDGADGVEVVLHRLFDRGFLLGEDADQPAGRIRLLDQAD